MKKLILILLLALSYNTYAQFDTWVLASYQQRQNEASYDTDAQAFIDVVSTLTESQEIILNDLVLDLKADGLWSKLDAIYPFIGGTEYAHKFNLKDPQDLDGAHRLEYSTKGTGSIVHDATGMELIATDNNNGAIAFTNFHLSDLGASGSDFEGSISIYSNKAFSTIAARPRALLALSGSENFHLENLRAGTNKSVCYFSDEFQHSVGDPTDDGRGFASFSTDGAFFKLYAQGVEDAINSISTRSLDLTTDTGLAIGSLLTGTNETASASLGSYLSSARYAFVSIGSTDLTATDHANLYTIVTSYNTALSRENP